MIEIERKIPYSRQLVLFAIYDICEQMEADYRINHDRNEIFIQGNLLENDNVIGCRITEQQSESTIRIWLEKPNERLSESGIRRTIMHFADGVEQHLENEGLLITSHNSYL